MNNKLYVMSMLFFTVSSAMAMQSKFSVQDREFLKKEKNFNDDDFCRLHLTNLREVHKDPVVIQALRHTPGFDIFHVDRGVFSHPSEADLLLLVPLLTDQGHDPNRALDAHQTRLLHYAVGRRYRRAVQILIRNPSVNINVEDSDLNTPLHRAVMMRDPEMIRILLQRNDINVNLPNRIGQTVVDLVHNNQELEPLILQYIANPPEPIIADKKPFISSISAAASAGGQQNQPIPSRNGPHMIRERFKRGFRTIMGMPDYSVASAAQEPTLCMRYRGYILSIVGGIGAFIAALQVKNFLYPKNYRQKLFDNEQGPKKHRERVGMSTR